MPDEEIEGEFILNNPKKQDTEATPEAVPFETPKSTPHFYSNLLYHPENVLLEDQTENEELILLVRRDLITNLPWILTALVLILIPPLMTLSSSLFTPFLNLSSQVLIIATLFYYLIVLGFILVEFIIWYFNIGLVTNIRIIDFDLHGVLSKHISETKLELVEDVSYSQVGSIRTIFDYGDVHMQTAGAQTNFEFDRSPNPARIVKIISNMIGEK